LRKIDIAAGHITVDWPAELDEGEAEPSTAEDVEAGEEAE
jgi:hypothetical protein